MSDLRRTIILTALAVALAAAPAAAQCILANPSFELGGSGGAVFGGWNQFGSVGSTATASHGSLAARVSGPGNGAWDVSAFWQRHDSAPGEQFRVTGVVRHPSDRPLMGACAALVNIEWRDAAGELIDYQSVAAADAASATDAFIPFDLVSDPAPAGTVAVHLLLGVLQSPDDPVADVIYDQVTLFSTALPTIDDRQWGDFPGGRTLDFAGLTWRVKGPGYFGPGPNVFCDGPECVWVDDQGRLHLTLANAGGVWRSTEVVIDDALGYGDYIVTTRGRLDLLDPAVVLGLFLWQYGPCWDPGYLWWNAFNEVDIEYSRWGDPGADIAQFVAQPYDYPGNLERFDVAFADQEVVSHAMRWLPDRVEYRVWRGGPAEESAATTVHAWTYTGPHLPRPEQPRLHLNLWRHDGAPASDQEVVFEDVVFVPAGGVVSAPEVTLPSSAAGRLLAPAPNPFNPATAVRFELAVPQTVVLDVVDVRGRLVRRLLDGTRPAGRGEAAWDGRDEGGRVVASGVYLVRLRGQGFVESRRVTLVQ